MWRLEFQCVCVQRQEKTILFNRIVHMIHVCKKKKRGKNRNFLGFLEKPSISSLIPCAAVDLSEIICKKILCHRGIPNLSFTQSAFIFCVRCDCVEISSQSTSNTPKNQRVWNVCSVPMRIKLNSCIKSGRAINKERKKNTERNQTIYGQINCEIIRLSFVI